MHVCVYNHIFGVNPIDFQVLLILRSYTSIFAAPQQHRQNRTMETFVKHC